MFIRFKLNDGGELLVHKEDEQMVMANVNGLGRTTWSKRLTLEQAAELRDYLTSQL